MVAVDLRHHMMLPLRNGVGDLPALGFGTLIPDERAAGGGVETALETGFRYFDCAERYCNERVVGDALARVLARGAVKRKDVFVTTKLWNNNHRPERVSRAFEASRQRLRLDYIDLYLIHTPFAFAPGSDQDPRDADGKVIYDNVPLLDTWRALEQLVDGGRCKAIGLSDVSLDQLEFVCENGRIKPAVVQIESHPYLPQREFFEYCHGTGTVFLAFASLGHGISPRLLDDPEVTGIANRVKKSAAPVLLAWGVQRGAAVLTSSATPKRIKEDFDISSLPDDAMRPLDDQIGTRHRFNPVVDTGIPGFIPRERQFSQQCRPRSSRELNCVPSLSPHLGTRCCSRSDHSSLLSSARERPAHSWPADSPARKGVTGIEPNRIQFREARAARGHDARWRGRDRQARRLPL
ncbi:MAG: aldo/keto reductase [Methylocystis sp.]